MSAYLQQGDQVETHGHTACEWLNGIRGKLVQQCAANSRDTVREWKVLLHARPLTNRQLEFCTSLDPPYLAIFQEDKLLFRKRTDELSSMPTTAEQTPVSPRCDISSLEQVLSAVTHGFVFGGACWRNLMCLNSLMPETLDQVKLDLRKPIVLHLEDDYSRFSWCSRKIVDSVFPQDVNVSPRPLLVGAHFVVKVSNFLEGPQELSLPPMPFLESLDLRVIPPSPYLTPKELLHEGGVHPLEFDLHSLPESLQILRVESSWNLYPLRWNILRCGTIELGQHFVNLIELSFNSVVSTAAEIELPPTLMKLVLHEVSSLVSISFTGEEIATVELYDMDDFDFGCLRSIGIGHLQIGEHGHPVQLSVFPEKARHLVLKCDFTCDSNRIRLPPTLESFDFVLSTNGWSFIGGNLKSLSVDARGGLFPSLSNLPEGIQELKLIGPPYLRLPPTIPNSVRKLTLDESLFGNVLAVPSELIFLNICSRGMVNIPPFSTRFEDNLARHGLVLGDALPVFPNHFRSLRILCLSRCFYAGTLKIPPSVQEFYLENSVNVRKLILGRSINKIGVQQGASIKHIVFDGCQIQQMANRVPDVEPEYDFLWWQYVGYLRHIEDLVSIEVQNGAYIASDQWRGFYRDPTGAVNIYLTALGRLELEKEKKTKELAINVQEVARIQQDIDWWRGDGPI